MHPIERLRYVARAGGAPPSSLVREAAGALGAFADEPAALVTACRRLVDRHPHVGAMWWLASRMLSVPDPAREAWRVADELDADPTAATLAAQLPEGATVVVLGWPEAVGSALRRRGDLEVLLVDTLGEGASLARRLRTAGGEVAEVPEAGLGSAVASAELVLVEALAMGAGPRRPRVVAGAGAGGAAGAGDTKAGDGAGDSRVGGAAGAGARDSRAGAGAGDGPGGAGSDGPGAVAVAGSWAAAAVARSAGVPTWLVAGTGSVLPGRLWEALTRRLEEEPEEPWDRPFEVVPLDLIDVVVGPGGPEQPGDALRRAGCPVVPELLRPMAR